MKQRSIIRSAVAAFGLLFSMALSAQIAGEVTLLTLHLTDGKIEQFNLPDEPEMKFEGDNLTIVSKIAEVTIPRADIEYFNFMKGEPVTSISTVNADYSFSYVDNNHIDIIGQGIKEVTLYSVDGNKLLSVNASSEGRASVCMAELPKGIYIVSVNGKHSVKIIKQ